MTEHEPDISANSSLDINLAEVEVNHEAIIGSNLDLVTSVAEAYRDRGIEIEDLVQEGIIGLMRAAETFDPDRDIDFSYYAVFVIRRSIIAALINQSRTIRISKHMFDSICALRQAKTELSNSLDRDPTSAEIAERLGVSEGKLEDIVEADQQHIVSIDEIDESTMAHFMDDAVALAPSAEDLALPRLLREKVLSEREQKVISMHFGLDGYRKYTFDEIGSEIGVTHQRVQRIKVSALEKLRRFY